ncbi:hypothetical protein HYQ46_011605 [Verticillium longisporum]|nr:hypothetical protein HYQ46_011605 [Verticillium longisporum]
MRSLLSCLHLLSPSTSFWSLQLSCASHILHLPHPCTSQAPCNPSPTLPLHPETAAWTLLWRCLGDLVTSAISVNSHHQTPSSV